MARQSRATIEAWVEDINLNGVGLSDWELELMATTNEKIDDGESLSQNTEDHIERIHKERCK